MLRGNGRAIGFFATPVASITPMLATNATVLLQFRVRATAQALEVEETGANDKPVCTFSAQRADTSVFLFEAAGSGIA